VSSISYRPAGDKRTFALGALAASGGGLRGAASGSDGPEAGSDTGHSLARPAGP
jgi:hypothetical protein